jgi:hypothetical protein
MSALLAVGAETRAPGPVLVVAGGLSAGGRAMFESHADGDLATLFDISNMDWDGHCWVVYGNWIADVSLCRTAYSGKGPPGLREHVTALYGEGRGALLFTPDGARSDGFRYRARYILTDEQVEKLARGAWASVKN